MRIDIDAARAARLEAEGEPHELVIGGTTYEVPAEAPWMFVHWIVRGHVDRAMEAALGEESWHAIRQDVSKDDGVEIQHRLLELWGMGTPGEPQASSSSSSATGASSRPTSNGSTGST